MKIELVYDETPPVLDPVEILGTIRICNDDSCIEEDATYLDSWVASLVKGLERFQDSESMSVDIAEEPTPIYFQKADGFVTLHYGNQSVRLDDIGDLRAALENVARSMILRYGASALEKNPVLSDISNWLESAPDPSATDENTLYTRTSADYVAEYFRISHRRNRYRWHSKRKGKSTCN